MRDVYYAPINFYKKIMKIISKIKYLYKHFIYNLKINKLFKFFTLFLVVNAVKFMNISYLANLYYNWPEGQYCFLKRYHPSLQKLFQNKYNDTIKIIIYFIILMFIIKLLLNTVNSIYLGDRLCFLPIITNWWKELTYNWYASFSHAVGSTLSTSNQYS